MKNLARLPKAPCGFKEPALFFQNSTTKIVVSREVFEKDGFGRETSVLYSLFRFVLHRFK